MTILLGMTLNFEVTVSTLSWVNDVATHCHPCRPFGHETITSVAHWVLSQNFPFGLSWWLSHLKKHPVDHHLVEIIIKGIPTMFIGLCFETSVYMVYKPIFWGKPVKPRASFGIPSVFWTTMDPFETNIDTGKPNPMWSNVIRPQKPTGAWTPSSSWRARYWEQNTKFQLWIPYLFKYSSIFQNIFHTYFWRLHVYWLFSICTPHFGVSVVFVCALPAGRTHACVQIAFNAPGIVLSMFFQYTMHFSLLSMGRNIVMKPTHVWVDLSRWMFQPIQGFCWFLLIEHPTIWPSAWCSPREKCDNSSLGILCSVNMWIWLAPKHFNQIGDCTLLLQNNEHCIASPCDNKHSVCVLMWVIQ